MTACWIGIDPGLDGGIAAIIDGAPMPALFAMPTRELEKPPKRGSTKKRIERELDTARLRSILQQLQGQATELYVMIERPQLRGAKPLGHPCPICKRMCSDGGQSVTAQAKFYGQGERIKGQLEGLGIPFEDVHPATWKADVFRGASDKDDARVKASQLYPAIASKLTLKKTDGLAESLLLADYGRRRRYAPF